MATTDDERQNRLDEQIRQRSEAKRHPLQTVPRVGQAHGTIPNTPLVVSLISFLLGSLFALGFTVFILGGGVWWWATYQLGFFLAAWSAFHWGEFAVTAGWNLEKCSVDCKRSFE